jgi:DNA-binding GntR family transcriptional regulator
MTLDISLRNTPLSEKVADIIIQKINDGTYSAGSQIPPEKDLANLLNVSRSTIRKAMSMLVVRGLIVQKHGIGTFVSKISQINNPLNEAVQFFDLIARFGFEPEAIFEGINIINADHKLAEVLHIKLGDDVLQSEKIFTADGKPVIYVINSIPTYLIPEEEIERILVFPELTEPLYEFFENICSNRIEKHVATLMAVTAGKVDFPNLQLDRNDPLLLIEEIAYNNDDVALWHSYEYFPQNEQMSFNVIRIRN